MISELTFVRQYTNFWNQLLPGIDHYLRLINAGTKERIYSPIGIPDNPLRRALINSISFRIFYLIQIGQYSGVKSISSNLTLLSQIKKSESERLKSLDNKEQFADELTPNEIEIISIICDRLLEMFLGASETIVYPKFDGCGLILSCSGDIFSFNTLYEVKAGESNFKRQDLCQLLLYCALNSVSFKSLNIEKISLLNPRNGLMWTDEIDEVAIITSGYSSSELYGEIISYVANNYQSI